jgi:hypothetical protein
MSEYIILYIAEHKHNLHFFKKTKNGCGNVCWWRVAVDVAVDDTQRVE